MWSRNETMRRVPIFLGLAITLLFAIAIQSRSSDGPQQPAAQQSAPSARFAFGGNVAQVPAEFAESLVFLPVEINKSQPSMFELDSIAAASSISPKRAAELGLTGTHSPVIGFPGLEMEFATLAAVDKPNFSAQTGLSYFGTLGEDFFSRVVIEIDYARQTLRIYDPAGYKYSGKGTSFPVKFDGPLPIIQAKFTLPGQKTHEGDFVVDTALDASLLISERFAEAHRVFSSHLKTIPASDPQIEDGANIVLGRLSAFHAGAYEVRAPIAAFVRQNNSAADPNRAGVIGGRMLRRFNVVFDFAHQRLILEPNTKFEDYDQEDKSGIAVIAKGPGLKTFEIFAVQPNTPGAEAGVQKGDIIAGIDDEAAADLSLSSIRYLFRQVGHKYKLLLQRNGQSLQITVQMRRLI